MSLSETAQNDSGRATALKRLTTRFGGNDCQIRYPTDFTQLKDSNLPQNLANSFTYLDIASFQRLSPFDVEYNRLLIQDIQTKWDELRSDVKAIVSDHSLSKLFMTTISRLLALRNYNSATAIIAALHDSGVDQLPCVSLLDTADNYIIYRGVYSNQPGLPFPWPYIEAGITILLPDLSKCIELLREQTNRSDLCGDSAAVTNSHPPNAQPNTINAGAKPTLLPARPVGPPVFKTAVYKFVDDIAISVDIYIPETRLGSATPIMLYIHGGGWVGGNRTDCSRLLLLRFLEQGFVVCSMDYRLMPESTFKQMQEDVRDMGLWLRTKLQSEVVDAVSIDDKKIVVVGASSGALLALQTPKLWECIPSVILQMYGPTDLRKMPSRGHFSTLKLPECTAILRSSAFDFDHPPTKQPLPTTEECHGNPRTELFRSLYKAKRLLPFLLGNVDKDDNGKLVFTMKESTDPQEVAEINPLHLCQVVRYPPTCQIMGEDDELFQTSHVIELHTALRKQSVQSKSILVPGVRHSFDTRAKEGGVEDKGLSDAVLWVSGIVFGGVDR